MIMDVKKLVILQVKVVQIV